MQRFVTQTFISLTLLRVPGNHLSYCYLHSKCCRNTNSCTCN